MSGWMSEWLPDEIVAQILLKLPVKPLIRFTSVSKFWCSYINNPHFISTQISQSSLRLNPLLLHHSEKDQYSVGFEDEEFHNYKPLYFPFTSVFGRDGMFRSTGYSNGLLCLFDRQFVLDRLEPLFHRYEDTFILWNPSIGKALTLPQPNFTYFANCGCHNNHYFGFGFDANTNDYKVFRMMVHSEDFCELIPHIGKIKIQAEIYSFNTNSWEIIATAPTYLKTNGFAMPQYCLRKAVFIRNAFHWALSYTTYEDVPYIFKNYILVFDIQNEAFSEIMLPKEVHHTCKLPLKVFRDSLIAYGDCHDYFHATIWVMEEYGDAESWVKLAEVGDPNGARGIELMHTESVEPNKWRVNVMGFRKNGEPILKSYHRQVVDYFVETYVESLALFDKGNAVENCRRRRRLRLKRGRSRTSDIE